MQKVLNKFLLVTYLIRSISWLKLWKLHNRNSKTVCLIIPSYPRRLRTYLSSGTFVNDFALIHALIDKGEPFRIVKGRDQVRELKGCTIYHNISKQYYKENASEYAHEYNLWNQEMSIHNEVIPNQADGEYWENKLYMHEQFNKLNISHPTTILVDANRRAPAKPELDFPILFKPAHGSGSTGIEKINNQEEYNHIISTTKHTEYLLQDWVDMRSDLRLIYIGDELVLHYWRLNETGAWMPTSTGRGSSVDFVNLPDQWMDFIFQEYKKLDLHTGAFDITWQKDDLNTKPLILEVSPSYMPNPAPVGKYLTRPYGEYKNAIWGKDAYYKQYIQLVYKMKKKLIQEYDRRRHEA